MEAKDYLSVIRERGKLTQAQVAARTGIPQPTISKIERGDVSDVMSKNYRALQELHDKVVAAPGAEVDTTSIDTTTGAERRTTDAANKPHPKKPSTALQEG